MRTFHPHQRVVAPVVLALATAMLLTACGPLAVGDGTRVDYRSGATYDVPAGEVLYVEARFELDAFGLDDKAVERAGLNWIPLGFRGESANALGWIVMSPPEAPEGWMVRLWEIRVIRERPVGSSSAAARSRVEATLRVDVPEAAYDLTRRVTARLSTRDAGDVTMTFLVAAK